MVSSGDRILASIPTNAPLAYYLDLLGADPAALTRPEERAPRIFAVIDLSEGQTLASVTAKAKTEITIRDKASAPAASIAEIHILQRQLDREPFDMLNHRLQIVTLLA